MTSADRPPVRPVPPQRPRAVRVRERRAAIGRMVLAALVVGAGLVLILTIGIANPAGQRAEGETYAVPQLRPEPGSAVPADGLPAPVDRPNASDADRLAAWAEQVEGSTGIPARVLRAYGLAEMWMRSEAPDCHLNWTTLAGVGRVESRHASAGGAAVVEDGTLSRPILGPPLDGSPGRQRISDTDRGDMDGDAEWDRAVGPMQFLPQTWGQWRIRVARDGEAPDPQQVDDAAVTAGRFLCGRGRDLATPGHWWQAVLAYNRSVGYAQDVFSGAEAYAKSSRATRG